MTILPSPIDSPTSYPGTYFPETPPQSFPVPVGWVPPVMPRDFPPYNTPSDALPNGQANPIPGSPTNGGPYAIPFEQPILTPTQTNTTGGMVTGGMNTGSTTSSSTLDWYGLLNALGFTKANPVQTSESAAPVSSGAVQQASLLPTSINMNTVFIAGFVVLIIYLVTK